MRGALTLGLVAVLALDAQATAQPQPAPADTTTSPTRAERPARARRGRARTASNVATLPGFQMLPDGGSRFHCIVHGTVGLQASSSRGRFEVLIRDARLALSNDRRPLETRFFETPVDRVVLVRRGSDVAMRFDMRADVPGDVRTEPRDGGGTLVIVQFPAGQYMREADRRMLAEQAAEPTMSIRFAEEPAGPSLAGVGTSARSTPAEAGESAPTGGGADTDTGAAPAAGAQPAARPRPSPTTRTRNDPSLDALDDERPPILNRR